MSEQALRGVLDYALWQPTTLQGHTAGVARAAWSPDGQRIVTASADGTVRV